MIGLLVMGIQKWKSVWLVSNYEQKILFLLFSWRSQSPPFLRHPYLNSAYPAPTPQPTFLKFLFSLPSFLSHPLLRYFRHPHSENLLSALIQHTNLPYTYTCLFLDMPFFHKIMLAEKIIFLQMYNTTL